MTNRTAFGLIVSFHTSCMVDIMTMFAVEGVIRSDNIFAQHFTKTHILISQISNKILINIIPTDITGVVGVVGDFLSFWWEKR